ncbi:hypothetical protein L208DRAFT_1280516 [Tricholoma matsutake]|nr:hypothetical protein L208DRAFT_1280516 [Tricholoma matsutake 945]
MAIQCWAVLQISEGSTYDPENQALHAITFSTYMCNLGLACNIWFWLQYKCISKANFKMRARDLYHGYFFFSLTAHVPSLCLYASLLCFHGLIAFRVWPLLVGLGSCVVGLLMTVQFWVYHFHRSVVSIGYGVCSVQQELQ